MGKPAKKQDRGWRGESLGVFSRAEVWAQERALREGSIALLIYFGLCRLEFEAPSKYKSAFLASARDIAAVSGVAARTIQRYLPRLERCGVIAIQTGRRNEGTHSKNRITLLEAPAGWKQEKPLRQSDSGDSVTVTTERRKRQRDASDSVTVTTGLQDFEADNSNTHTPSGGVGNNDAVALAAAHAPGGAPPSGSTDEKKESATINTW